MRPCSHRGPGSDEEAQQRRLAAEGAFLGRPRVAMERESGEGGGKGGDGGRTEPGRRRRRPSSNSSASRSISSPVASVSASSSESASNAPFFSTEEDEIRGPNVPLPSSQEYFDEEEAEAGGAGGGDDGDDEGLLVGDLDPDPVPVEGGMKEREMQPSGLPPSLSTSWRLLL